ncbi:TIGR03936 family radical SAM-associated protein [Collinsella sp. zg1085]|uniref:TIGR03936 family radical SAM-associated protein n=1 Tax=Collinsella sp. zg1085 TaxID=2844380 RepID=UPI001C0E05F5|nr:TIGR03936 family radical SAM-associated protein [Collinsella sp. zg1085]QWT17057.1 TIGR03936 family radical SAM-associated protein [Collinsella sp. zg1085]
MSEPASMNNKTGLFKLRVCYQKMGRLSYLGHLEVINTLDRVIRRAGLPYAVTQGYSPHMRIGFSSALPVGTASKKEYYDVVLTEYRKLDEVLRLLKASCHPDLAPSRAAYIAMKTPNLGASLTRMRYEIRIREHSNMSYSIEQLDEAFKKVCARKELVYQRGAKIKTLSLERTLISFEFDRLNAQHLLLSLDCHADNEGSLRPELVVAALDNELDDGDKPIISSAIQQLSSFETYWPMRTEQYIEAADGGLIDPLDASLDI